MAIIQNSSSAPSSSTTPSPSWNYGHPYSNVSDLILPWGNISDRDEPISIAQLIPSLPDDPKARFLDEIASTPSEAPDSRHALPTSPKRSTKRIRTESGPSPPREKNSSTASSSSSAAPSTSKVTNPKAKSVSSKRNGTHVFVTSGASKALNSVSPEEFWERMAFRQECVQGAVTGFFVAIFGARTTLTTAPHRLDAPSAASKPSEVPFDDPFTVAEPRLMEPPSLASATANPSTPSTLISHASPIADGEQPLSSAHSNPTSAVKPEDPQPGQVAPVVLDRIIATLLNLDFGSLERARRATGVLEDSIRALCGGGTGVDGTTVQEAKGAKAEAAASVESAVGPREGGEKGDKTELSAPAEVPKEASPKVDEVKLLTSSHSPRPDASSVFETYIYGPLIVSNPPLPPPANVAPGSSGPGPSAAPVTVLQVRKKRKAPA